MIFEALPQNGAVFGHAFRRLQHGGPGLSAITGGEVTQVAGWKIVREMLKHVWPRDQPALKARVVLALCLLVGAKVQ